MAQLIYNGEQTTDEQGIQSLISQLVTAHRGNNELSIDSISLRLTDSNLRIIVTVGATGTLSELDGLADTVAQGAVDLGFEPDIATAMDEIDVA